MARIIPSVTEALHPSNINSKALVKLVTTVYYGTIVHTPALNQLQVFPNCAVVVGSSGSIINLIPNCSSISDVFTKYNPELDQKSTKIVDISGNPYQFFFPGFVDTHIHAPQFPNAGIFGNSTLLDWLDTYTFPLEASFENLHKANKIYSRVVHQTLQNGTTTASYFATIHPEATKLLSNICFKNGQRALIGRVCMDDNSPDFYSESHEDMKTNTVDVCNHIKQLGATTDQECDAIILPTLTPRFAPSCTAKTLAWLGDFREEEKLHVQSHVSENIDEIKLVSSLFPDASCYTGVYEDYNLLGAKTVLAHGVHLTPLEISILHKNQSGISHCPISNSSLTSGETRVRQLLNSGIKVSLGTDMSGGFSPSILSSARQAHLVSRHLAMKTKKEEDKLSVNDVLYLATKGGAQCLDMESTIGDFGKGKKWECQLVDLKSTGSQIDIFDWQLPDYLIQRGGYHLKIAGRELLNSDDYFQDFHGVGLSKFDNNEEHKWINDDGTFIDADQSKFEDLIAKWLFNGDDRNTTKVYVNGRCVIDKTE